MFIDELCVWAVNAYHIDEQGNQESVIVLVYCRDAEMFEGHVQKYIMINRMRLAISFSPLPLNVYLQHYVEPEGLLKASEKLSEDNPIMLFYPKVYQPVEESSQPCLEKTIWPIREVDDSGESILLSGLPDSIAPRLWKKDSYCYVIIHAVKSFWFPSDFQEDDIQSACLYEGRAAEDYESSAPYLIKLPQQHGFTERLFSENPPDDEDGFNHWGKNAGIFLTSSADFEEILQHFRRFIYMPTYDERLLYFRFFDPVVLENYLDMITCYPKKLATFFGGDLIHSFAVCRQDDFVDYVPTIDLSETEQAKKQFEEYEMQLFIEQRDNKLLQEVGENLMNDFPSLSKCYEAQAVHQIVRKNFELAKRHDVVLTGSIYVLAGYQLFFGKPIDELDEQGVIMKILQGDEEELSKMKYINERIEYLEEQCIIIACEELL